MILEQKRILYLKGQMQEATLRSLQADKYRGGHFHKTKSVLY